MYCSVPINSPGVVSGVVGTAVIGRNHRSPRAFGGRRRRARKTEVEQLRAALGQHDVRGLQIAMHDAVGDAPDRARRRWAMPTSVPRRAAAAPRSMPRGQRLALELLHDQIRDRRPVTRRQAHVVEAQISGD